MKRTFKLTESELRNMIAESVKKALYESEGDEVEMLWQELRDAKEAGADVHEILDILHRLEAAIEALPEDDPRAFREVSTYKRRTPSILDKDQRKTQYAKVSGHYDQNGKPINPFRKPKDWQDEEDEA